MYFFLTAYRDYRDNYGVEILTAPIPEGLGLADMAGVFSKTEIPIAFAVVTTLALLSLVRSNRLGLQIAFTIMIAGQLLMGLATYLLQTTQITGLTWYALVGLGAYLAYVPFGCVLFDRLLAYTRFAGTAVFAIYLTDAIGYTGSVTPTLPRPHLPRHQPPPLLHQPHLRHVRRRRPSPPGRHDLLPPLFSTRGSGTPDLIFSDTSRLKFFKTLTYGMSLGGAAALIAAMVYFLRQSPGSSQQTAEIKA
jgi:hypothetical protein